MHRARVAAAAAASVAGASIYAVNEDIVKQRAARLERLQTCAADVQPRVQAADVAAQKNMSAPIVVRGLMDQWPAMQENGARSWSFDSLRQRMGQTLVDTGSASGGVPFYLVAHNAIAPGPGRHDLALYVFDSNFEQDAAYESLLDDWSPLVLADDDVFASERVRSHADRPSWRWLLAGPPGSGLSRVSSRLLGWLGGGGAGRSDAVAPRQIELTKPSAVASRTRRRRHMEPTTERDRWPKAGESTTRAVFGADERSDPVSKCAVSEASEAAEEGPDMVLTKLATSSTFNSWMGAEQMSPKRKT